MAGSITPAHRLRPRFGHVPAGNDNESRNSGTAGLIVRCDGDRVQSSQTAIDGASRRSQTNGLLVVTYREAQVDYEHPLRAVIETVELLIRDFGGIGDRDQIEQAGDGTWIVVNEDGEVMNQFTISPYPAGGFRMDSREYC